MFWCFEEYVMGWGILDCRLLMDDNKWKYKWKSEVKSQEVQGSERESSELQNAVVPIREAEVPGGCLST